MPWLYLNSKNSSVKCHFRDNWNNLKNVCVLYNIKKFLIFFDVRMIPYAHISQLEMYNEVFMDQMSVFPFKYSKKKGVRDGQNIHKMMVIVEAEH